MPSDFSSHDLGVKLEQLDHKGRVFFALLCAERHLPCLKDFMDRNGDSLDHRVTSSLDMAFDRLCGVDVDDGVFEQHIGEHLLHTPQIEEDATGAELQAVHAVNCIVYALELLLHDEVFNAVSISQASLESVYLKILSLTGDANMESVQKHDLYKKEFLKQSVDIETLKLNQEYTAGFIQELREKNRTCMIQLAS
ncbi:MAG: YjaG family protein [Gammaproteobacteria bacterium]|nr:YjaG family protein [Gammaproteobacteria bacterium]MDH5800361.1 YjaG family protein [Gammaproteobacteria bacterium]